MGLEAENIHICEPKKGAGDQKAIPRRSRGGREEVAGRVRGGPKEVPAMVRKEMCSGQGLPGEVFTL